VSVVPAKGGAAVDYQLDTSQPVVTHLRKISDKLKAVSRRILCCTQIAPRLDHLSADANHFLVDL